jgi:hypothetical protein
VNTRRKDFNDAEWSKVLRWTAIGRSRRGRRLLALLWLGLIASWLVFALRSLHSVCDCRWDGFDSLFLTAIAFVTTIFFLHRTQLQMNEVTLEDHAIGQHGVGFTELPEDKRYGLFQKFIRDRIRGSRFPDERELALQREADVSAYHILRWSLPVVVLAYWLVCLMLPITASHVSLIVSAIVLSWLVIAILVLPVILRLWTEPDSVAESKTEG